MKNIFFFENHKQNTDFRALVPFSEKALLNSPAFCMPHHSIALQRNTYIIKIPGLTFNIVPFSN